MADGRLCVNRKARSRAGMLWIGRGQTGAAQRRVKAMTRAGRVLAAAAGLMLAISGCGTAMAQKPGGILRIYHRDSPASMSIHEEGSYSVIAPMMPVFSN